MTIFQKWNTDQLFPGVKERKVDEVEGRQMWSLKGSSWDPCDDRTVEYLDCGGGYTSDKI